MLLRRGAGTSKLTTCAESAEILTTQHARNAGIPGMNVPCVRPMCDSETHKLIAAITVMGECNHTFHMVSLSSVVESLD